MTQKNTKVHDNNVKPATADSCIGESADSSVAILVGVPEAARMISVTTETLYMLLKQGRIPSVQLGERLTRISVDELRRLASKSN